uniref:Disease resistance protein RGA3 n=1 Tax=Zea mays TaxID=4577 RepID=A0A804MTE0_MAIZE
MAELAISLVVAPLVSRLKEKASSSLLDQYNVMEGMEKHHETLVRWLPPILKVITDAERQASRRGVEKWLEQLKTAVYEANEVFDDFEYEALRRRAKKNGHIAELGVMTSVKLFPTHNRVAFHIRMGYRLRRVVDTFKDLIKEMDTFRFNKLEPEATTARKELREMDSIIVDPENIVARSRDDERKKIVNILVNGHVNSRDLMVVPIVGMPGLGKTTLAQLIYKDPEVKEHFHLLKWVTVSDDFSVLNLANKICNASERVLEDAVKKLQEHLKGKRYLLVLDDVWNRDIDKWRKLKACLMQVAFPQLEILHIERCGNLAALTEASHCGGDYTVARSTFPELKRLILEDLCSFERWVAGLLEIEEEHALFPVVEIVVISKCPKLTTVPRAPKVKELVLRDVHEHISLGGIRCMTSLSTLLLDGVKLDVKERWDHPSSVVDMQLWRCSLFFQPRALVMWVCYWQLQDLTIYRCDELVSWPEKVFQSLISLRRLWIGNCKNLIGYAAANVPDQATSGRSELLPHLEYLEIWGCQNLVELFNSSPALKRMEVRECCKLESLYGKQLLDEAASSTDDVTASAHVEEKLSPSSLESLTILDCDRLSEVVNLPSSLRVIDIQGCFKLRFMSGQLDALNTLAITNCPELRSLETCIVDLTSLEILALCGCKSLASLPSAWAGRQEYSSLRQLTIRECPGIKSLPSTLQQRLDNGLLDFTNLDSRRREDRPPRRLLGLQQQATLKLKLKLNLICRGTGKEQMAVV